VEVQNATRVVTTAQLVVGAIAGGLVAFGAISAALVSKMTPVPLEVTRILLLVLLVLAVTQAVVFPAVGRTIVGNLQRKIATLPDGERETAAATGFQTLTIVRAALVESVGLFAVVVFLLTGKWVVLIVPAACLVVYVTMFPTHMRLEQFVRRVTGPEMR
jgi:hypothetical protein